MPARIGWRTQKSRREQLERTRKPLDNRRARSVPLTMRIAQAGLGWSRQKFLLVSIALGIGGFLLGIVLQTGIPASLGLGFVGGMGVPLWMLEFLKKRREARFLSGFPDAVDNIVRSIKAGLPLLDSLRIIANDAPEPLRSEFRAIVETHTVGIPIGEACGRLCEQSRWRKRISSGSSSTSSKRPEEIWPKHSTICRGCCAFARR